MKMGVSKCRLFIMFLTIFYIFDSVLATGVTNDTYYMGVERRILNLGAVGPLIKLKFNGELQHDLDLVIRTKEIRNLNLAAEYKAYLKEMQKENIISDNFMWPYALKKYKENQKEFQETVASSSQIVDNNYDNLEM